MTCFSACLFKATVAYSQYSIFAISLHYRISKPSWKHIFSLCVILIFLSPDLYEFFSSVCLYFDVMWMWNYCIECAIIVKRPWVCRNKTLLLLLLLQSLHLSLLYFGNLVAHYHQKQNWFTVLTNEDSYVHFYIQLQNTRTCLRDIVVAKSAWTVWHHTTQKIKTDL